MKYIFAMFLLLMCSSGFAKPEATISVRFEGGPTVVAEVRNDDAGRAQGLMGRKSLGEKEGMLFLFDEPALYTFWMKNMKMSLDFIWIGDGKIEDISENIPPCLSEPCSLYQPKVPVSSVLEVQAGFIQKNHLKRRQKVQFEDA